MAGEIEVIRRMSNQVKEQPSLAAPYWDVAPRPCGDSVRRRPTGWQLLIYETLETVVLAAFIWLVVNFATARFVVDGSSMEPNFHTGQLLIGMPPLSKSSKVSALK